MLQQPAWLSPTVGAMEPGERRDLMLQLNEPEMSRRVDARTVMGKLILLHPELAGVLNQGGAGAEHTLAKAATPPGARTASGSASSTGW